MPNHKDMVTIAVYVLREQHKGWRSWVLTADAIQGFILARYKTHLNILDILDLLD